MNKTLALGAMLVALTGLSATAAQPTRAIDYAVFSQSNVTLNTYSTVLGPVYSGGNSLIDFGYGIQRPSQNAGDFYSRGNFTLGSLSEVTGNVYSNQNVTLQGSAEVAGNVVYGGAYAPSSSSDVTGSVLKQTGSVASVALPAPSSLTPGFFDSIHTEDFTLTPGSYGAVQMNGSFNELHLSSGVYKMQSLTTGIGTALHLDFNGMEPIKVQVQGNIFFDSGLEIYVNGAALGNGNAGVQTGFAALTLFETHGNFTIDSGFLNYFFGTIFAPNGSVTLDVEDMFGSIIASGPVTGNAYISLRQSQLFSTAPIQGDFTGDGVVNGADLTNWRNGHGQLGATTSQGDADGDSDVDGADFLIWQRKMGATSVAANATAIPEPTGLALAGCVVVVAASARRRHARSLA